MQRPLVTVPPCLLRLTSADWSIDWRSQSSPEAQDGVSQTVFAAFPRWVSASEIWLRGEALRAWRAIRSAARGRAGVYRLRMCDPAAFSRASIAAPSGWLTDGIPSAEGNPFDTGAGYWVDPFVVASFAAPAGSGILDVDITPAGVAPVQGQIMSAGDWPFMVTSVTQLYGSIYRLTVEMPLRAAVAAGDPVLMIAAGRFEAIEEDMGNPAYGAGRTSTVRLSLREVLTR